LEPNTLWSGEVSQLPEGLIVVSSVLDCLRLHLLSALQDLLSPAIQDISGRHIDQCLVVAVEVAVVDEAGDSPLQLAG
jgi:hypothetical protein